MANTTATIVAINSSVAELVADLLAGRLRGRQTRPSQRKLAAGKVFVCETCGTEFSRDRIYKDRAIRFCSRRCARFPDRKSTFRTPESTKRERVRANGLINMRIRNGHFGRPKVCDYCGKNPCRTDAHHPDYKQADLVSFLCRSCHMKSHFRPDFEAAVAAKARSANAGAARAGLLPTPTGSPGSGEG